MKRKFVVILFIVICIIINSFAYCEGVFPCETEVQAFLALHQLYVDNLAASSGELPEGVSFDSIRIVPTEIEETQTEYSFYNQNTGVLYAFFSDDGTGINRIGIYFGDMHDYQEAPLSTEAFLIAHSPKVGITISKLLIAIQNMMNQSDTSAETVPIVDGVEVDVIGVRGEQNTYLLLTRFDEPITFEWIMNKLEENTTM